MALLLAPALSPGYDLSAALRRVRRGVYSFYSARDVVLLRVGTTVLGSIDRAHEPAAGAVGFRVPIDANAETRRLYAQRLRQIEWTPQLKDRYGVDGSHIGWSAQQFVRQYLAPMIQRNEARHVVDQMTSE